MHDKHDWANIQSNLDINNEHVNKLIAKTREENSSQINIPNEIYSEHLSKIGKASSSIE